MWPRIACGHFLEVAVLSGLGIRMCHGCKGKSRQNMYLSQKDFTFHMKVLRIWNRINVMEMYTSISISHVYKNVTGK